MKTIEVSDEDYVILMELSKELQTQKNWGQAFPYFWEPSSEKLVPNVNDEGMHVHVYDDKISESFTLEEYSEAVEDHWLDYLEWMDSDFDREKDFREYNEKEDEIEWCDYIRSYISEARIYTEDLERICEHNPSLFLSDVEHYIDGNKHHLGADPKPYSRSSWRMPKMYNLVKALCRLNPQPVETIEHEIKIYTRDRV